MFLEAHSRWFREILGAARTVSPAATPKREFELFTKFEEIALERSVQRRGFERSAEENALKFLEQSLSEPTRAQLNSIGADRIPKFGRAEHSLEHAGWLARVEASWRAGAESRRSGDQSNNNSN